MTDTTPPAPQIDADFLEILNSDRVSERTRAIMAARAKADDPDYAPRYFSPEAFAVLQALFARVLPQEAVLGAARIDLVARLDQRLSGPGDGWRFAFLPSDAEAYRQGLSILNGAAQARFGHDFAAISEARQDELLHAIDAGALEAKAWNAQQLSAWFSDVRADAVQLFISHPAVQGRLGISAIANGGDGFFQGFTAMGEGVREAWEPVRAGDEA